jgi:hypothetical protein
MEFSMEEEEVISQLAFLEALHLAAQDTSTETEISRRDELALWLTRLNSPIEVATMALVAAEYAETATKALDDLGEALEAMSVKERQPIQLLVQQFALFTAKKVSEARRAARQDLARKAAAAAIAKSPKQADKSRVFALWQEWQEGKFRFRSAAHFARHIMDEFPTLQNQKVIEGWVTAWRRDAALKQPAR